MLNYIIRLITFYRSCHQTLQPSCSLIEIILINRNCLLILYPLRKQLCSQPGELTSHLCEMATGIKRLSFCNRQYQCASTAIKFCSCLEARCQRYFCTGTRRPRRGKN